MPRFLPTFLFAMAALLGTAAAPPAQSPCQQNRIANGDFESFFPLWTKTGPVQTTFDATTNVNGIAPSRSWKLWGATGSFTVHAPAPLALAAGTYEFSLDLLRHQGYGTSVQVGLTENGTRTVIGSTNTGLNAPGRSRIAFLFSVATGGTFTLDLQIATNGSETLWLDNAVLHEAVLPFFTFDQHLRRPGIANTFSVHADPNDFVAVCVALAPQVPDLTVPTCSGTLQIGPLGTLITAVPLTSCDVQGDLRGSLMIPAALAGVPLWWQTVRFSPGCHIGCADMIAF